MATNDANIVLTNGLESGKGRIAYTIGKLQQIDYIVKRFYTNIYDIIMQI